MIYPPPVRRALLILLGAVVALAAMGALYQTLGVRRDARRFPPPGRLVDVGGGRRLHLVCIGDGEPAVIFESSGLGSALSSEAARAEVATRTRVCSYDRMGTGWSDPGFSVISAGMLADDLETLLARAALHPPYIFVPASVGGLTVELFARRHPERVAGLVFVDGAHSALLEHITTMLSPTKSALFTQTVCAARIAARLGVLRFLDPLGLQKTPRDDGARAAWGIYRAEPMATLCGLVRGAARTGQELRDAPPLAPDVPLTVLSHDHATGFVPPPLESSIQPYMLEWQPLQQGLARRSVRGTWRVVPGSDHLIGNSQPHVVALAVLDMLAQVRGAPWRER